ncbi:MULTISPECIES: hypothetical protein [unclassified Streptomyces]|uniref:hypothetical protein n=1 Tax=unclassified Streptomyces TaxID=2593676 RepID=UPI002DD9A6A3|nr:MULTISPECIES: hypothetical protein [unclassified Streptomyces]WSA96644.1 hypothetical protein OIE63_37655 [Streptomyces sp. NBC_01795]WSB81059.1 hypothetical protein OHB04_38775 [Streptomyces sp. NBC_01775]WSS10731.1 hypothetical protein OG533_01485 [Streptomyces sp. NBC_01186]WSS39426.1 hypothetical protein OG220_01510 [Streptomyces sp. NBC_01187]
MANDSVSLTVLTGDELAADRFPDLPVRLVLNAAFAEEDREGRPARVEVRMRPDRLADLAHRVKAAQTALAIQARRRAEAESVQEERERATHVALRSAPPTDTDLLKRVLVCLGGVIPPAATSA